MNLSKWGNVTFNNDSTIAIVYKNNSYAIFKIKLFNGFNEVDYIISDKKFFSFIDKVKNPYDLYTFTRIINDNHIYEFINGNCVVKKIKINVKFLYKSHKSLAINEHFITMDIIKLELLIILWVLCLYLYMMLKQKNIFYWLI